MNSQQHHAQDLCEPKPNQTPASTEKGGGREVPSLAEALPAILSYWDRKGQFTLKVYPLINSTTFQLEAVLPGNM